MRISRRSSRIWRTSKSRLANCDPTSDSSRKCRRQAFQGRVDRILSGDATISHNDLPVDIVVRCAQMDSMTCREFEDHMRSLFGSADAVEWKRRISREDWTGLPQSEHIAHLVACDDCRTSLYSFLDVPDLDYLSHPCFHVAYYAANTPARCIDARGGVYGIITDRHKRESIVIAFCPWCGIPLPTSAGLK